MDIKRLVAEHLDWLATAALVIIPTLVEISPIKINPWSMIARFIGNALTKDVTDEVKALRTELNKHIEISDERDVKQCRLRILRFNDELLQGQRHTKEHFDNVLEDIDYYERYCSEHPLYENNKAALAIKNCKNTYEKCSNGKSFL